jgi:hypothetical protein
MKLPTLHTPRCTLHAPRLALHAPRSTRRESGSAVIIVMALLAILLVYMAGNLRTLTSLGRELKLLERKQNLRLQALSPKTNAPPAQIIRTNSPPP